MYSLFNYFHKKTKDKTEGGLVSIPEDTALWPQSWKTITYKTIERAEHIILQPHTPKIADFYTVTASRTSPEKFNDTPLTLEQLKDLLQLSYGEKNKDATSRRPVPSGGRRYPLELYILVWNVEGLTPGVYHYNIKNHELEHYVWKEFSKADILNYVSYSWVETGGALLVITSLFNRSTRKYGSRGYRYALIEAGHLGQMMYLNAKYLGCDVRALGGTNDTALEELLDINGVDESVVYALGIGA